MTYLEQAAILWRRHVQPELVFCQVLIRKTNGGFDLRHAADREADADSLRRLGIPELRDLARTTASGAFRPLKSAPNLRRGWRVGARSPDQLTAAIDHLYPGAVPDWLATETGEPPVTSYRDYTARQTGMYRITTHLDDAQAARMARACCDPRFCLKRRLWTVGDLASDPAEVKSLIPCLEPCAVLLEFARKIRRLEQDENTPATLAACDPKALEAKLADLLENGLPPDQREADFSNPNNPRLLQWKLLKLASSLNFKS